MSKHLLLTMAAAFVCGAVAAKDRIVVVPAHPDDLIPCFDTCLLSMSLAGGSAEGFMSFVQPLQGQGKTIFQELPPPKR